MSSNPSKAWVKITVAILTAIGLIVPAILNNWDNLGLDDLFPPPGLKDDDQKVLKQQYTSEVKSAIQLSMTVGKQAYWNLDSSLLEEVFMEGAFKLLQSDIAQHRSNGHKIDRNSSNIRYTNIAFTDKLLSAKIRFTRSLRVSSYSLHQQFSFWKKGEFSSRQKIEN